MSNIEAGMPDIRQMLQDAAAEVLSTRIELRAAETRLKSAETLVEDLKKLCDLRERVEAETFGSE